MQDRYAFAIGAKEMEAALDFDGVAYSLLAGPIFVAVYSVTGIGTGCVSRCHMHAQPGTVWCGVCVWLAYAGDDKLVSPPPVRLAVCCRYLADRARRTWLLAGLLAAWSGVTLLVGYATSFWQVALLRGCQGLCEAGCTPLANGLIGDYFAPSQRGAALGVYNWGIYMGYGAAYGVGNIITRDYGWRAMFKFFGLPGVVLAAALACVHEPRRGRLEPDEDDGGGTGVVRDGASKSRDPAASGGGVGAGRSTRKPASAAEIARYWCKAGPLVLLCVAGAVRNAGGYVWAYNTNLFFENVHHQSAGESMARLPRHCPCLLHDPRLSHMHPSSCRGLRRAVSSPNRCVHGVDPARSWLRRRCVRRRHLGPSGEERHRPRPAMGADSEPSVRRALLGRRAVPARAVRIPEPHPGQHHWRDVGRYVTAAS